MAIFEDFPQLNRAAKLGVRFGTLKKPSKIAKTRKTEFLFFGLTEYITNQMAVDRLKDIKACILL